MIAGSTNPYLQFDMKSDTINNVMKYVKSLLPVLIVSFLLTNSSTAQTNQGGAVQVPDVLLKKRLDEYLSALRDLKKFNGCIYVSANGRDILKKAYNISTEPKNSLAVSNASQFDIHSVSKLMAHSILIKMQQEGKLQLTDTLGRYLPGFPNGQLITIDQLVYHKSGLPRELSSKPDSVLALRPEEIIALAGREKLEFTPGTATRYSNVGYEVIYYLIGKLTGKPFSQSVKEYIFDPLGMNASGAHFFSSNANLKHQALNHRLRDGAISRVPNITKDEFATARIYSTAGDLMLYLRSLNKEPFRSAMADAKGVIEKNGGSEGIRAQIYTNTRLNYSFVLLSNYDELPFQQTITDLVSIMEGKPYQVPAEINRKAVPVSADILKRYTGSYEFAEANHTRLEFRVDSGQLAVYQEDKKILTLFAESETVFFEDAKSAGSFEFIPRGSNWEISWTYQGIKFKGLKTGAD